MRKAVIAALLVVGAILASWAHLRSNPLTERPAVARLEALDSPTGPGAAEPNLSVAPDGHVYLSWLEPADSAFSFRVSRLAEGRWSEPRTIRTARDFFVNWADFPSVLALGKGRLAAHWLQRTGTQTYAYGVRLAFSGDDGRTWSAPLRPHTDSSNTEHGFVSLWATRDVVEAAWLDGRKFQPGAGKANEMTLASAGYRADGATGSAERILDTRVCDCCQTGVAVTSEGPVVVYRDRSPDEIRDMYVVRRQGSGATARWTQPAPVHRDGWKVSFCPVNGPSIDAKERDVVVAWFTAANDTPRVKVAFSRDAGATFGAPVVVDGGQPAGRVDVVMTRDRDALVSWVERVRADTTAVRVRRVRADGTIGAPVTVAASSAARASGFPRMVVTGNDAIFAWTQPGRPSQVHVARMPVASIR